MSNRLVVDVGNTNIAYGIFVDGALTKPERIPTVEVVVSSDIDEMLDSYIHRSGKAIDEVVSCCGVARILKVLENSENFSKRKTSYLGGTNTGGAKISYETPETLGPDRIANTIAVSKIYGQPALVIDCGTAINIDFVNAAGEFEGGVISPGLVTARDALAFFAPALPEVENAEPKNLIGRNTVECIQSGVVGGAVALINEVHREVLKENSELLMVVTGGHGKIIHQLIEVDSMHDEWLTLKGLGLADLF